MDLSQAKVSLLQAVAAAESAAGGKVVNARLERRDTGFVWEIEVAKTDGTMNTVLVDAVTERTEDRPVSDGDDRERDGDDFNIKK